MPKLVATKSFVYASRRLMAGDYFTTRTHSDARVLVAIRKARPASEIAVPPAAVLQMVSGIANPLDHDNDGEAGGSKAPQGDKDALNKLRADYLGVLKKKPFPGWDAAELQRRIDEALAS